MWQPNFDASNKRTRWLFCISGGVYLNLFILFFEPYSKEIFAYDSPVYYQFVFGGIVTVVFSLTGIALPHFFPRFFIAPYFTAARFFVWYFLSGLLCHIPSFFYDNWLAHKANSWSWFAVYEFQYAIPTLIFISIPFFLTLYFIFTKNEDVVANTVEQNDNTPTRADAAEQPVIESKIEDLTIEKEAPQYKSVLADGSLQLKNASGKTVFETSEAQLVYITAANNYVEIFYLNEGQTLTRMLLRQTLIEIENQLVTGNNAFCRCHKAYIINKEKIISVTGNAKGYQLILRGCEKPIPVSRKKNDNLISQYLHLLDA